MISVHLGGEFAEHRQVEAPAARHAGDFPFPLPPAPLLPR